MLVKRRTKFFVGIKVQDREAVAPQLVWKCITKSIFMKYSRVECVECLCVKKQFAAPLCNVPHGGRYYGDAAEPMMLLSCKTFITAVDCYADFFFA